MTLTKLLTLPTRPNDYLIEGFLWKRQSVMFVAKDKVGKSVLTLNMAANLTTGEPFLNCYDISGKYRIVYVQCEGSRETTKEHFESMLRGKAHIDTDSFGYIYRSGLQLHTFDGGKKLIGDIEILGFKPDVVFIDPIYKAISGGDISNAKDATIFTDNLDRIKEHFNCSTVCCQHKRKTSKNKDGRPIDMGDEESMGSSIFKNYFDHTINMRKHKNDSRSITCDTQRNGHVPKKIDLDFDFQHKIISVAGSKHTTNIQDTVLNCIVYRKRIAPVEIAVETGITEQQVRSAISALTKKKEIKIVDKVTPNVFYGVV